MGWSHVLEIRGWDMWEVLGHLKTLFQVLKVGNVGGGLLEVSGADGARGFWGPWGLGTQDKAGEG